MLEWTFFEFVSSTGRRAVRDWIGTFPKGTRARVKASVDALVSELQLLPNDQFERENGVGQLRHDCSGLFELVMKVEKIQVRPIGFYGPGRREFTLLAGAVEKGNDFEPRTVCETANERKRLVASDRRFICEYFST